ncbi:dTDP-fucopyranose mutase [Blastocladiella emersonii ATCC 22665]|nr:dTDP-fucopyranose mutase [Blastocladiella emersonii ATCC 22665]
MAPSATTKPAAAAAASLAVDLDALLARATASLEHSEAERKKREDARPFKLLKMQANVPHHVQQAVPLAKAAVPEAVPDAAAAARKLVPAKQYSQVEKAIETAGDKWFNLPATELTPELRNDLLVIKNRDVLESKRHYKKDAKMNATMPKFFHVGRIVEAKHEFYSSRLTKKERKNTLVEQILADTERRTYFKKKAEAISIKKARGTRKFYALKKEKRKRAW